ncbi:MAG: hypothetical protein M3121_01365 [Chloroflexota bacterium]|nr:hypothetical protein [Chloroflexota bacterium]
MTTAALLRSDLADDAISIDPVLQRWAHTGKLSITYHQLSDSLTIYRFGRPVPSFVEPVDDVLARLVSLENETEETGLLIEAFLAVAVHQRPWLNPIARLLKLPDRLPGDFSLLLPDSDTSDSKEQIEPDEQWLQPAFAAVSKLLLELKE